MVGEWVMVDAIIDFRVWVARAFGAKLPYRPIVTMFGVEEFDKGIERVAICALRICTARSGSRDDCT